MTITQKRPIHRAGNKVLPVGGGAVKGEAGGGTYCWVKDRLKEILMYVQHREYSRYFVITVNGR